MPAAARASASQGRAAPQRARKPTTQIAPQPVATPARPIAQRAGGHAPCACGGTCPRCQREHGHAHEHARTSNSTAPKRRSPMSSSGSSVQTGHQARGGHRPPPKRAALIDHDAFETEAEAVAERVVSMPVAPRDSDGSGDRPDRHPSEWPSGRRPLPRAQQFGHGEGARRSQASAHTFSATAGCGEPALQPNLSEFRTAHPRPIDRPTLPGGPPARRRNGH